VIGALRLKSSKKDDLSYNAPITLLNSTLTLIHFFSLFEAYENLKQNQAHDWLIHILVG
jgi:hypothetical protein